MIICPNPECKTENEDRTQYCSACGTNLALARSRANGKSAGEVRNLEELLKDTEQRLSASEAQVQQLRQELESVRQLGPATEARANRLQQELDVVKQERNQFEQRLQLSQQQVQELQELQQQQPLQAATEEQNALAKRLAASEQKVQALLQQIEAGGQKTLQEGLTAKDNLVAELEQKLGLAEQSARKLSEELASKHQQLVKAIQERTPDGSLHRSWVELIPAGLILAAVFAFSGFILGKHGSASSDLQKRLNFAIQNDRVIQTRLEKAEKEVQTLQQQLESRTQESEQRSGSAAQHDAALQSSLMAREQQLEQLKQALKSESSSTQSLQMRLRAREQQIQQLEQRAQLDGNNQQALVAQLKAKDQRLQRLQNTVSQLNSAQKQPQPPPSAGVLIWEGPIRKSEQVEISNGQATSGRVTAGVLPGRPCTFQPVDSDKISIRVAPAPTNNWNRVVFQARRDFQVPQGKPTTRLRFLWDCQ
jgi:chromosome segregation ATPase